MTKELATITKYSVSFNYSVITYYWEDYYLNLKGFENNYILCYEFK